MVTITVNPETFALIIGDSMAYDYTGVAITEPDKNGISLKLTGHNGRANLSVYAKNLELFYTPVKVKIINNHSAGIMIKDIVLYVDC